MTWVSHNRSEEPVRLRRVRLSQWARQEGIARITAYRMLQRGILPVPSERSPTGRWYVLLPDRQAGRVALYARASPGPDLAFAMNHQVAALSEWAAFRGEMSFVVVKEVADPLVAKMPKLASLLADQEISDIVVESQAVVGEFKYELLVAALAPQGRSIILTSKAKPMLRVKTRDARAALLNLCKAMYGPEKGTLAAHRALEFDHGE